MVLFKGTQRLLDAPIIENSSDAAAREIEIYGITNYNELLHKTVHILSNAHGTSAQCTMNVNSLGAKSLKTYKNGIKVDLFDGWIAINQVYAITYDGTDFLVSHINPEEQDNSTVEIFHTSSMILDLTNESTSEEITQAFDGEENIANFQNALSTQQHVIIDISNSMGTGDYNCCYQFTGLLTPDSTETVDLISYVDTNNNKLITMTFTRGTGNTYSSVNKTEISILSQEQIDNKIAAGTEQIEEDIVVANNNISNIQKAFDAALYAMPSQLKAWSVGDGTSYPPSTPDENTLTAYMTSTVINQLEQWVEDGTLIKSNNILSGADRKSRYTYLYVVLKSYSSMYNGDYEYLFNNITGGQDFYIYWDSSESKWFWNQKGLIQGEPCFIEGTKVLTPSGLTNIEEIEAGDEVISYNFETQQNETKTVTETYTHPESIIYTIEANGERIQSTGDHPFYVIDKLAVEAKNLSATDKLRNKDGEEVDISSVSFEITDVVNVYEIVVEDTHTYYVGDSSILVYNEPAVIK